MTDRSFFSDQQWHVLTDAPVAVMMAVALVGDHGPISMIKESAAGAKALMRPAHPGPADLLISQIASEAKQRQARHDAQQHKGSTPNIVVDGLLDDVAAAVSVLSELPTDESVQVRTWLYEIAAAVAGASKGVKPAEQALLERLAVLLAVQQPPA